MELPHIVHQDEFVRLEPIAEGHREGLRAACAADREVWAALYPYSMLDGHFDPAWDRLIGFRDAGTWLPHIVVAGGEVVGISSYLNIDLINDGVEIGGTYYRPQARSGAVNPAAKRLLMTHAFAQGARRVQYCVDAINLRSRAAVLKLGAVQEGIIRHNRVTWTGRLRDTVVFSILVDEWPAVRQRLDDRLTAFAAVTPT